MQYSEYTMFKFLSLEIFFILKLKKPSDCPISYKPIDLLLNILSKIFEKQYIVLIADVAKVLHIWYVRSSSSTINPDIKLSTKFLL